MRGGQCVWRDDGAGRLVGLKCGKVELTERVYEKEPKEQKRMGLTMSVMALWSLVS